LMSPAKFKSYIQNDYLFSTFHHILSKYLSKLVSPQIVQSSS